MELVTIGITSFNAEGTIIKAIECAINQDYQNYEIIIVDDGSDELFTLDQLNEFNANELFSQRRITLAPFFIVLGYVIIIVAIMKRPKSITSNQEDVVSVKSSKNKK